MSNSPPLPVRSVVADTVDAPSNVSLRVTTDLEVTFDVADENEVCFHVPHPLDSGERLVVIHVRDAAMAGRLAEVFDRAWAEAVPLSAVVGGESVAIDSVSDLDG